MSYFLDSRFRVFAFVALAQYLTAMKKIALLIVAIFLLLGMAFCQEKKNSSKKYIPSIGLHGGGLSYSGDVGGAVGSNVLTYWKPSYGFYIEKKISPIFGVTINGLFGKISKSQLDDNTFLNFETTITNFDANVLFDFDNGKIINESSPFAPFVSVGIGFLSFNPKGDLFNNGTFYNHWDDGTLRDVPQSLPGSDSTSNVLTRDYTYESSLTDSTTNYSKTSITIPIRFGLKFEMSEHLDVRISGAYIIAMTDYLDNVSGGGNDKMIYTSFGLQYNFESKTSKNDRYKDFSFTDLDDEDSDNDGVVDHKDLCQGTPKGVDVDSKGCALDGDKDGVPNYKDKDLTTPAETVVNQFGVQLTDEMLMEMVMSDSVETEYSTYFDGKKLTKEEMVKTKGSEGKDLPSLGIKWTDEEIVKLKADVNAKNNKESSAIGIPGKFKKYDLNNNGYISSEEMSSIIDEVLKGSALSVDDLNKVLKFYFEQ